MDENELRISGAEKAVIALAAHREPAAVRAALVGLADELDACLTEDERQATLQAKQLILDGRGRYEVFSAGALIRRP
jgi:hypothetical protein